MSEQTPESRDEQMEVARIIGSIINEHGTRPALFALQNFLEPMIGMIALFMQEQALMTLGQEHGIDHDQQVDAVLLVGALTKCKDHHQAWIAAELLTRLAQDKDTLVSAMVGVAMNEAPAPAGDTTH